MTSNLISIKTIKGLLNKYQVRPSKKMGQNFLVSWGVLQKIIKAADLGQEDVVLEIGPGIGTLTDELAKRIKKVFAIEKDKKMVNLLNKELELKSIKNVEITQGDILKIPDSQLPLPPYKIVANLPYYITSPIIRKFLESKNQPKEMILMVQKEVAQRICAKAPKMNFLAISVQFYAQPKIIDYVSKKAFWPRPKVDSAIIKITPKPPSYLKSLKLRKNLFFKIVKAGFSQPRKQLLNNLSKILKLEKERVKSWLLENKIQPTQRAETLTLEDWQKLTLSFPQSP